MNLAAAEFLFSIILLIAAYLFTHTLNGSLRSYLLYWLGDSTAKDEGYTSLNPLVHVDLIGFLMLIFLGWGWFQTIPIDPYAFNGPWRYLKLAVAYFSEAFISICIAVVSLFFSVMLYGQPFTNIMIIKLFSYFRHAFMLFFSSVPQLHIAELFAQNQSASAIVIAFFLVSLVYLNIMIAVMSLIFNAFRYALIVGFEHGYAYIDYAEYLAFLGPFLVLFLFGSRLIYILLLISEWGACRIASIVGV